MNKPDVRGEQHLIVLHGFIIFQQVNRCNRKNKQIVYLKHVVSILEEEPMYYFLLLLTLIFVLAKLFGLIAWSWLLVFVPLIAWIIWIVFWIGLVVVIGLHED